MRALLTILCSCWLLPCCDKPASSDTSEDERGSNIPRRRHEVRQSAGQSRAEQSAALREIHETALAMQSPSEREKALADVAWNAIEIDPDLAFEAFRQLSADNPEKIRLIQHYAMRLAEQDADAALEWASTLESDQEIAAAKGRIALAIAETDPVRAANLLSESGIAGREFDVAVVQVIQRWATQSPPDAAEWVSSFPPSAAREAGIRFVAERWLPRDASAAFAWLDAMQDGKLRQETARAIEGIILQQPEETRNTWLQHADEKIRSELEQQRDQAIEDVGDNIPQHGK